jgi:hypothetical protein
MNTRRTPDDARLSAFLPRRTPDATPDPDVPPLKRGNKSGVSCKRTAALAKTHPETRSLQVHGPDTFNTGELNAFSSDEIADPTRLGVNGLAASLMPNRARKATKWASAMGQGVV